MSLSFIYKREINPLLNINNYSINEEEDYLLFFFVRVKLKLIAVELVKISVCTEDWEWEIKIRRKQNNQGNNLKEKKNHGYWKAKRY